jgi:hypothetical protein
MPEHLFGHKGAFRLVQLLKLRRSLDLIEFGVCREALIEDVKDVMVARLKLDHKPRRTFKGKHAKI